MSTKTRFEKEAWGNSKMAYSQKTGLLLQHGHRDVKCTHPIIFYEMQTRLLILQMSNSLLFVDINIRSFIQFLSELP